MASFFLFKERILHFLYQGSKQETVFKIHVEQWLKNVKFRVKESSYAKYYNLAHNHIIPCLGEITLRKLTTGVVQEFIEEKLKNGRMDGRGGLSEKTVRDILIIIKEVCSFGALQQDDKISCQIEMIKIKSQCSPSIAILEKEAQKRLEQFLVVENDDLVKTGVLISLYMGLRLGEVCALKRENIMFEQKILQVRRTMQRLQVFDEKGDRKTKVIVTEPKSRSSVRDIPIPEFILERLKKLEKLSEDVYLVTGEARRFIEPRTLENIFERYLRKCQVEKINYHGLRHTFATRCIEKGFDAKSLSEILGHSNVNITLNRYVHSSMEQKRKNMEMLEI